MSSELYKKFKEHTLKIGVDEDKFEEILNHMFEIAITRIERVAIFYKNIEKRVATLGIEIGLSDKHAKSMANSFINFSLVKETIEDSIPHLITGSVYTNLVFWLDERANEFAQSFAKGIKIAKIKTARNFLSAGFSTQDVAKLTELSLQKVEKLQKKLTTQIKNPIE